MTKNPFVIVELAAATLTGHNFAVQDSRTGEQIGSNLTRRMASEVAAEEWAIEQGDE